MKKIVVHKSSSAKTRNVHYIHNEMPDSKTYASLVLLNNYFQKRDRDNITLKVEFLTRIRFSREYLNTEKKRLGKLTCKYCNKTDLIVENEGMIVPIGKKATVDHIVPVSKGGAKYDLNNIVIACGRCNTTKGNLSLEEFLVRLEKNKPKWQKNS